ncbi:MAG: excinuclease ABC subunit UvrC [Eubacteriales bacterium]|nr:excinuclease ABC subunit UvrC [Eubacteriales bacterium]
MNREQLFENAKALPATPGVYIIHNQAGTVIYVGKSKALRHRVSSYFAPYAKHAVKTEHMVASAAYFEVYHTNTDLEALILENQFIKQYMPRYNIKLKDSRGYPYIELTGGEYPVLEVSYSRIHGDSRYFGPYSSASAAYSILNAARKAFRLPSCAKQFPKDIGKGRPCLNFHINRCMGLCVKGQVSKTEYGATVADTVHFLKGDYSSLIKKLENKMSVFSENLEFEKAAKLRDIISSVKMISDKQHIVAGENVNADIFGIYADENGSAVNVFFVRNGIISDRECMFFGRDELIDSGSLTSLLFRFYTLRGFIPESIYIDFELMPEDRALLCEKLSENTKTKVIWPQKGEKRQLVELARANAKELMLHKREGETKAEKFLVSLAAFLKLEVLPERIEAYDVSNHGDEAIVCGMAVWEANRFVKKKYRSFNMKTVETRDDYSSMREGIGRRLAHNDGDWAYPDLILVDGGGGHVSVIKNLLNEKGVNIPVFGMIKDEHHKTRTLTDGENEMSLNKRQDLFNFFYRFQEEVHNVAFGSMDKKRCKSLTSSSLTDIPGVGKKTAEKLLLHFGGLKAVRDASYEELASLDGISKTAAREIADYFIKEKETT